MITTGLFRHFTKIFSVRKKTNQTLCGLVNITTIVKNGSAYAEPFSFNHHSLSEGGIYKEKDMHFIPGGAWYFPLTIDLSPLTRKNLQGAVVYQKAYALPSTNPDYLNIMRKNLSKKFFTIVLTIAGLFFVNANFNFANATDGHGDKTTKKPFAVRTASVSGNWNNTTTWGGQPVPGNNDDVSINAGVIVTVDLASNANSVTVNGTLNVNSGFDLNIKNNGFLMVNNGGSLVFNNTSLITGGNGGNPITVTINSGANLTTANTSGFSTSNTTGSISVTYNGTPAYSTGANYTYNGSSAQVTGSGMTGANALKINNAAGVTLSSALSTVATLTIGDVTANSIFNDGGNQITSTGTLNLSSGTFKLGSNSTATTFPAFGTNNISSGTTVEYAAGVAQTVSNAPSYSNLTFTGAGTKTLGGAVSASGAITIGTGSTLNVSASNFGINIGGNWTNNGTFTAGTGTVSFVAASARTISQSSSTTFYGLTINDAAGVTINSGAVTVTGTLDLTSGQLSKSGSGSLTMGNGSTITRSGGFLSFTPIFPGSGGTYNVVYTGSLNPPNTTGPEISGGSVLNNVTVNLTTGQTVILNQNVTPQGNLSVTSGIFDLSTFTINRSASGGTLTISNGATLKIGGTNSFPSNYSLHTFGPTSIVEYSGGAQTVTSEAYGHLTLSGSGGAIKTLPGSAMTIAGNFTLSGTISATANAAIAIGGNFSSSSSTFSAGAFTHTVGGNWSNAGTFNGNTSTINFNKNSGTQTLDNGSSTFNNLTRSGNGTLQLVTNNIAINGTLTLTNGIIDGATNNKTVTIGSSGSISGGSSTSYVSGKLLQTYSATGSKTFPIGKGGNYRPLSLNYTALTGTSVAAAEQTESTIPGTIPGGVTVQPGRYWTVSQSGGSSFTYNITVDGTGFTPGTSDANILKGDGVTNTRFNATFSSPNFTSTGFTGFSNFAVASSCDAPTIDAQPTSQLKCVGNSVTFSVTASGPGSGSFTYQWYKVGSPDVALTNGGPISGATSNSLTINPIAAGDAGSYYVIVSRPCGTSTQSNSASLTIDVTGPTIGGEGANTTIECTATPVFTAPTASDASGTANVQQVGGDVTGGNSCATTITRTWQAVDACGNSSATRSQTITQSDTQPPTIGTVADATIECTATPSFTAPTASDACNTYTVVQVGGDVTGGNSCAKTTTRTWRAIDACGNSSATRSQTVTQVDTQAPTIGNAGANETIECGGKPVFTAPTVSDACNSFTVVQVDDVTAGNASCEMTITRTWFAVDACGNSSATRSQTITQKDTQAPSIGSAGANTTIECTATPSFTAPTASDACNGSSVVQVGTDVTGGTSCAKTTTRTWLAVDDCGNSSATRSQTITQTDEQAPEIGSAGDNTTIECTATPSFTAPTASDACNTYTVVQVGSDVTGGTSCAKTTTRTWLAVDACGNSSATRSQTITQIDTQAPTIGSAGDNETIECTATPSFTAPTASDACNTYTVVQVGDDVTGGNSCIKTTTRTWLAVDACGNSSATRSQTITQADTQAPTIGDAGAAETIECTATPSFTAPTASDACNTYTVVQVGEDVTGGTSCAKTTTRTWRAVDACGNSSITVSQTITQSDTQAPTIGSAGDAVTIECTATPSFTAPTAADACNTYTVAQVGSDVTGGTSCAKTTTRTWLAVDACGNSSATRSQTITQSDTQAPTIGSAGANETIECTATPSFTAPTASDACNTFTIVQVVPDVTGGTSCAKTTTRTWLAIDACGNSSATRSQTITQIDTQAPAIGNAGANETIECTATPSFTAPTASDVCNTYTIVQVGDDVTGGNSCAKTTTRTWLAVDACGNSSATRSQTVTQSDIQAPTIGSAGANSTIECTATPSFTAPTASDACNTYTVVQVGSDVTGGNSCAKTTTRTWLAVDACGNSSDTRSQTITQVDTQAPTIGSAGAAETIECTATPSFTAPTASDACNTYSVVQVGPDVTGGNSCAKTITRTWLAVDACGNSSATRSQTITEVDTQAPIIGDAGANTTIECTATPGFIAPTASDACNGATVLELGEEQATGNSCALTITKTWYAVDDCGNSSATRSQSITVVDTQAPAIGSAGANETIECTATPSFTAPTASDACNTYTVVQVGADVTGGNSCAKTTTRTWLAVDACGNSSATRSQTVTQSDTQAPTIGSAGANETIECTATPSFIAPTASDACNTYTVVQVGGDVTGGNSCAKTTTRTWLAVDACGNSSATRSQTVTQSDTQAPTIGSAGANETIECTATPSFTAPTASDACNTYTVVQVGGDVTGGNSCAKTTTRTWIAVDACGNSSATRSQTVTQVDTQAPVIGSAGANSTIECTATPSFTAPTASDACNTYTVVQLGSDATGGNSCAKTTTRTWIAIDACGNSSATRSQTVTQVDTQAPAVGSAGANTTIECTATPSFTAPTASDACNTYTVAQIGGDVTGGTSCAKTTTRTWLAVDACGNSSATRSQTITQIDTHAPVISGCPGNITVLSNSANPSTCSQIANWTEPSATDACAGAVPYSSRSHAPGSSFPVGNTTVTYTFTDGCNNESTCSFTVTVVDNTPPNTVCQNITLNLDANGQASIPTAGTGIVFYDYSCDRQTLSFSPVSQSFTATSSGFITRIGAGIGLNGTPHAYGTVITSTSHSVNYGSLNYSGRCCYALCVSGNNMAYVDLPSPFYVIAGETVTVSFSGSGGDLHYEGGQLRLLVTGSSTIAIDGGSNDNCGLASVTASKTDFTCADLGPNNVTLTVTDIHGNVSNCNAVVTVVDITAPTIGAAGANETIECTATPSFTAPTASDACNTYTVVQVGSDVTGGNSCAKTTTRTWQAVDASGNSSVTRNQTITQVDTQAPIIGSAGANETIECTATPSFIAPTASDACNTYTVVQVGDDVTGGNSCAKTTTRTWRAIDACGNSSVTRSQTVTQVDTQAPTIGAAGDATTIECTATPSFTAPTASDACNTYTVVQVGSDVTGGNSCAKTTTRTWRAIDACGNSSATRSQTITQVDTQAPAIGNAGANETIECTATPSFTAPTASDACNTYTVVLTGDEIIGNSCSRTITKTWLAVDACGNSSATRSQSITVVDTQAPTIGSAGANSTIECTATPSFTAPTASDACNTYTVVQVGGDVTGGNSCAKTTIRTWLAVDACGNSSATRSQTVTQIDTQAPTIGSAGANETIECTATPSFTAPTASDACNTYTVVQVGGDVTGGNSCAKTTTRTWRAIDACGNSSVTRSQTVTQVDTQAPSIGNAGDPVTIECTATPSFTAPTASDACNTYTVVQVGPDVTGGNSCAKTTTRTWRAIDACGNSSSTRSQTVTQVDTQAPAIGSAGANTTIECTATPSFTAPTASDACNTFTVVQVDYSNVGNSCSRTITRTWLAVDACGNSSATRSQSITIVDTQAPTIGSAGANSTIECTATPSFTAPTAADACNSYTVVQVGGDVTGGNSCAKTTTRTWLAVDACGNSSATRSQTVTQVDTQAPTIGSAGANETIECTATPSFTAPTASDACNTYTVVQVGGDVTGGNSCAKTTTRTWRAIDACGNSSVTRSQTVTQVDTQAPTIGSAGANSTIECTATPSFTVPTASDACNTYTVVQVGGDVTAGNSCLKTTTRTWRAIDACGNSSVTRSQTVTQIDTQAPVITCPSGGPFIRSTNAGNCTYKVVGTEFNATATDACSGATLSYAVSGATTIASTVGTSVANVYLNFGVNTITWTATDACGNASTCSVTVNVNKVTTTTTVTVSPNPRQYSDSVRFVATVTPANCTGAGFIGGTVTFKIGTLSMGTATIAADGTATLDTVLLEPSLNPSFPTNGPLSPGIKTVIAVYNGTDPDYIVSNPTTTLTITQENAVLTYNGFEYFTTPTSACPSTGTINLSAYVLDTIDGHRGDIRNATVTFTDQFNVAYPNSSNLAVGSVTPGDFQQGIATSSFPMTLSGTDCNSAGKTFEVWTKAYNYYTGTTLQGTLVTLALPGQDNVTGGGHLDITNSAGCYAATAGSKMNFGFTMKWNKSGKNLQGQINIMFRRLVSGQWHTYQIKSNAINSMSIVPTTVGGVNYNIAYITTKANLTDVTNPNSPISLGGNLDLSLEVWDCITNNNGSIDKIGVTLTGSPTGCSNGLVFSSFWSNGATIAQYLSGGNINIRTNNTNGNGSPATRVDFVKTENPVQQVINPFEVKAFPNPSDRHFTIVVESNSNAPVQVNVFDITGRQVATLKKNFGESIQFGDQLTIGTYVAEVVQGDKRKTIKLVKQ